MPSRKAQFARTCEQMQFAEQPDRLSGQWYSMGDAHFHAAAILGIFSSGGRHNPERLVQINLGPPAAAKLGASERQIGGAGHGNAAPFDTTATPTPDNMQQRTATPQGMRGGFDWDALTTPTSNQQTYAQDAPNKPADFDEEEFLRGAKAAYARLNSAWDKRDLADIAQFSTPAFMKEIEQQAEEDKNPGKTEIMLVNASLVQVDTIGAEQIAQVYFNVLLREDPTQDAPTEVREIWHFTRPANGTGTWKLDGIQQVDNSAFN